MSAPTASFLCIVADKWTNKFMIAADLFETGKVLGHDLRFTATYNEGTALTLERAGKAINAMAQAEQKEFITSLFHLEYITVDDVVIYNDGRIKPYWNKEVRIISTGDKWFMLDDFLRNLGFKVETDEHRYIKNIILNE